MGPLLSKAQANIREEIAGLLRFVDVQEDDGTWKFKWVLARLPWDLSRSELEEPIPACDTQTESAVAPQI